MAEKKFNDRIFVCDKLPATEATHLVFRLGKIAAPLLGDLQGLIGSLQNKTDDSAGLKAIANFLMQLDPKEAQSLIIELTEKAKVQSANGAKEQVIYDMTFDKNLLEAFQVAAWVIQVNFGDFFGGGLQSLFVSETK